MFQNSPRGWFGVFHPNGNPMRDGTGRVWPPPEKARNISDGLSHTLAIGEHYNTHEGRGTYWAYTYGYNRSAAVPHSATLLGDYWLCREYLISEPCKAGWASHHPGGINFAMCDGSVHLISKQVDMEVFCRLASMAGGLPASIP